MLLTMRAQYRGDARAGLLTAAALDSAHRHPDAAARRAQACVELLIPVVKGWTETAQKVASLGVQVHGGMGFIEETGAAQHYARCADHDDLRGHHRHPGQRPDRPQARARQRRHGTRWPARCKLAAELAATPARTSRHRPPLADARVAGARERLWCRPTARPARGPAVAVPYLELWGLSSAAGSWPRGAGGGEALAAGTGDARFLNAKIATARFYADAILPQAASLAVTVARRAPALALAAEQF